MKLKNQDGVESTLLSEQASRFTTQIKHSDFAFEITDSNEASLSTDAKRWNYPAKVTSLQDEETLGTDGTFMHFNARIALLASNGEEVGKPDQVYLSFTNLD